MPASSDDYATFARLWRLAEDRLREARARRAVPLPNGGPAFVEWVGYEQRTDATSAEGAYYDENALCIALLRDVLPSRPHEPDRAGRMVLDSCLLAHEYGHFLSHEAGRPTEYQRASDLLASDQRMTPLQRDLVRAEEECAWTFGRDALAAAGFVRWAQFDRQRGKALRIYESRLHAKSRR